MNDRINEFINKVVIVTGAASGIGESIASKFHQYGAKIVIADVNQVKGKELVERLGQRALFIPCDISDATQVTEMVRQSVIHFGGLDIIVNNAGINAVSFEERVPVDQYPYDTWKKMIDVDLNGTFYCCKAAAEVMKQRQTGVIINIASVAGIVALRLQIGFVAAKAAVLKMTEAMALELAPYGIRVNAISPGSILTETTRNLFYNVNGAFNTMAEQLISFIPMKRLGKPVEISEAAIFLASNSSSYINGHNLVIDGAWTSGFNRDF